MVPAISSSPSKPQRVLACVLCQQRKIKCDRTFPCANCTRNKTQCVPATLNPRRRRRRFAERELLDRLRKYEDLLDRHRISFEPLHKEATMETESPSSWGGHDSDSDRPNAPSEKPQTRSENAEHEPAHRGMASAQPRNFWHAMKQQARPRPDNEGDSSEDAVSDDAVKKAFDRLFPYSDNILFGSRRAAVELTSLHPEPIQIFRLWQVYINNVDPLLKVTHTPSLQGRLVEAASNLGSISPALEALMFSIYSMSVMSLTPNECQAAFACPRDDLLAMYQFGCQQSLLNCGYLRTDDCECLTALYLSLISIGLATDPRSLSSMFGVVMRIARRIGIHYESSFGKCSTLEAEIHRRLWWSLKVFDTRISELASYKTFTLVPTMDCATPLNVNDLDLRPELKEAPTAQSTASEAIFIVVRSELDQSIRKTKFHLAFTNPALRPATKNAQSSLILETSEIDAIEKRIEDKYLQFCHPENPLHFMTIWMTRTHLAKYRLVEYYSKHPGSSVNQTEAQHNYALLCALNMLKYDTKIMNSPITQGYLWLVHYYFPLPAYIHILQDLTKRPACEQAEQAWEIMSENFEARVIRQAGDAPTFTVFTKLVLSAWESRETVLRQPKEKFKIPRIVSYIKECVAREEQGSSNTHSGQPQSVADMNIEGLSTSMPTKFGSHSVLYGAENPDSLTDMGFAVSMDPDQLDWAGAAWNLS